MTLLDEMRNVRLSDLSVKATIGLGGFGRVEMVRQITNNNNNTNNKDVDDKKEH